MHSITIPKPPADKPTELRLTIAVSAALAAQTALALIWTGAASERLSQLEQGAGDTRILIERTARLEEQSRFVTASLVRIEKKIDGANEGGK